MKIQTHGTGGLARSISCHETGLPEKPPLQATRKGGKWRVVHKNDEKRLKGYPVYGKMIINLLES